MSSQKDSLVHRRKPKRQHRTVHRLRGQYLVVQLVSSHLKQVRLAKGVLGIASVELEHLLDSVVALDIERQRLSGDVPGNTFSARRSGEGARVVVDTVGVEVVDQTGEAQLVSVGVGARSGNVTEVREDRVEQRERVAELRELEEKANNGNIAGRVLEHKVSLHREVFLVHSVLARGMKVELGQIVRVLRSDQGAIGQDNLLKSAEFFVILGSYRNYVSSFMISFVEYCFASRVTIDHVGSKIVSVTI